MAQIHNQLYRGDLSDALKRALGVVKGDGGVERFGETLTPIIHPWGLPEWAYLRKECLWSHGTTVAAFAAELGGVGVINPVDSNALIVVERISVGGAVVNFNITPTVLRTDIEATYALAAVAQARDQRWWKGGPTSPGYQTRVQIWTGTNNGSLNGLRGEKMSGAATATFEATSVPYILRPGGALLIEAQTVNTAFDLNVSGRIRTAYPGELV